MPESRASTPSEYDRFAETLMALPGRFDAMDQRFQTVEKRSESLERRFDGLEDRLARIESLLEGVLGLLRGRAEPLKLQNGQVEIAPNGRNKDSQSS